MSESYASLSFLSIASASACVALPSLIIVLASATAALNTSRLALVYVYESLTSSTNPNPGYFRYTGTFINGKSISLVANEQPKDSVYKSVEWTSSNSNVTVSESGVVTNNSASGQAADITLHNYK